MFDQFKHRFGAFRPTDPVAAQASRLFEQHSAELLSQARAFVQEQLTNPDGLHAPAAEAQSASSDEEERPSDYTDFVRWRRTQVARQLVADVQFQDWQADLLRDQALHRLAEASRPSRPAKSLQKMPQPRIRRIVVDQDDILLGEMVERHLKGSETDRTSRPDPDALLDD